jgi:hypothetical protein
MLHELAALLALAVPQPPGIVIDHQPAATRQYIGSPSIVILPGGDYVASHDLFGKGSTQSVSAVTRVFRSPDRGRTWRKTAEFQDQFWSNLFVHRKALYLMGTNCEYGRIVIRRSDDGGATWSPPAFLTTGAGYHTAPVPVVIWKGRLWRAMEFHPAGKWGHFEALLISAPVKADLLAPQSWSMTERLPFPQTASEGRHWLEGNAVVSPSGEMLDILRVDNIEKAAVVALGPDGRLTWREMVEFPGGSKKFTIRFDRRSKRYWALSNQALPEYADSAARPASVRNTLVLMSSADLKTWRVERRILHHPDTKVHAFQYVDWQFDGANLIVASRTAFDDEEGGAHNFHDANFLTFHRVERFRSPQKP